VPSDPVIASAETPSAKCGSITVPARAQTENPAHSPSTSFTTCSFLSASIEQRRIDQTATPVQATATHSAASELAWRAVPRNRQDSAATESPMPRERPRSLSKAHRREFCEISARMAATPCRRARRPNVRSSDSFHQRRKRAQIAARAGRSHNCAPEPRSRCKQSCFFRPAPRKDRAPNSRVARQAATQQPATPRRGRTISPRSKRLRVR